MPQAWAIEGVDVPGSVARMLAYVASGGAEGVVEPGGLKVQALATPGAAVRVMPGAAMIQNGYPGGSQQSYAVQEPVQATVPIAATTSASGRTDLVIARIHDKQYDGERSEATFETIQGVPANAGAAYAKALPYPAIALARVTLPASTATVQAQHITDLRTLARRRSSSLLRTAEGFSTQNLTSTSFVNWPSQVGTQIEIPEWAMWLNVDVAWNQVWGSTGASAMALGEVQLVLEGSGGAGNLVIGPSRWEIPAGSGNSRTPFAVAGWVQIPAALRGTTVTARMRARRQSGAATVRLDDNSSVKMLYLFEGGVA